MVKQLRYLSLFLILLVVLGCGKQSYPYIDFRQIDNSAAGGGNVLLQEDKPIRIAVPAVMSPRETIGYYRVIMKHISAKINKPVVLIERQTYEEINQLLANDGADIAFLSTGAYGAYRGLTEIEVLVMQELKGTAYYSAYIIVPKDSSAESLQDLHGKKFAFTDPLSYSGHIAVVRKLEEWQEKPETFFSRYVYTYSHDKAFLAVAKGLVDGGAFESPAYEYVKEKMPQYADSVKVIDVLGRAAMGPIVVRKDMNNDLKTALRQVFLEMDKEESLKPTLQGLTVDRFILPIPGAYESVLRARLP